MEEHKPLAGASERPTNCCCFGCRACFRFALAWLGLFDLVCSAWLLGRFVELCEHHTPLGWSLALVGANLGLLLVSLALAAAMHRSAFGLSNPLVFLGTWIVFWCRPSLAVPACGPKDDPTEPDDAGGDSHGCCGAYQEVSWRLDRRLERPRGAAVALLLGAIFASARAAVIATAAASEHLHLDAVLLVVAAVVLLAYLQFVLLQFTFCSAMRGLGLGACCSCLVGCLFGIIVIFGFPIGLWYLLYRYRDAGKQFCLE